MLGVRKRSHRLALAGSAAAAVCLGGTVLGMSGEGREGWVASGPAGVTDSAVPSPSRPSEGVSLIPLDGADASDDDGRSPQDGTPQDGSPEPPQGPGGTGAGADPAEPGTDASSGPGDGSQDGGEDEGSSPDPGHDRPGPDPSPTRPPDTAPPGPAELRTDEPVLSDAEDRWCQKVTVAYRNTGDSAVRSGQVNFATHVIGLLGVDWGTIRSAQKLPVPIDPGESGKKTYAVCVDAWRVPLGMHVETRDITVDWD